MRKVDGGSVKEYNSPSSEEEGYENFVKNLNVVNDLNKKHPGDIIAYQLNRFADLNPAEIKDHFALDILPYDHKEKEDVNQKKSTDLKEYATVHGYSSQDFLEKQCRTT
ncbi:hypothetical protein HW555_000831 [Spodoptera exigua]|uniref:Cathepsin propeptide inhibitor domain-containing protein n=1 Tax=Spodoptera exigua TaxID=7107 RepID=A0A835GRZ3_SPOEX|nr:hypothetical protein HW555_000831 [Spodoptera exigua]